MLTFKVTSAGHPALNLSPPTKLAYDDLLATVATLLNISTSEELFLYTVPNDHTDHVRLCPRLLKALYENATKGGFNATIYLKLYTPASFIFDRQPLTALGTHGVATGLTPTQSNQQSAITSTAVFSAAMGSSYANKYPKKQHASSVVTSQQTSAPKQQNAPVQVTPQQPPKPAGPTPEQIAMVDSISSFVSNYNISKTTGGVAQIKQSGTVEHKGGSLFSIPLSMENVGDTNIGKEYTLSLAVGKGVPTSFSLPLLKPQGATRTISLSVDFATSDGLTPSYWAVKNSAGQFAGTVLKLAYNKNNSTLFVECLEFSQAAKELEAIKASCTVA